jgi:hypothetical protein
MTRLTELLAGMLAPLAVTIVLASPASAAPVKGSSIGPGQEKRVSNCDYCIHSDDFGSFTWLNPFFRIAESHGWLKSSWYWTGIAAGFELWRGGRGLSVSYFSVDS